MNQKGEGEKNLIKRIYTEKNYKTVHNKNQNERKHTSIITFLSLVQKKWGRGENNGTDEMLGKRVRRRGWVGRGALARKWFLGVPRKLATTLRRGVGGGREGVRI